MGRLRRPHQVLLILTALYLAQGLPFGFFVQALPVVLRARGVSLEAVGLTALLALPWGLKFLWAPLVDRYGRRRHWIFTLQLAMIGTLLALATHTQHTPSLPVLLVGVFLTNLFAATQDIATDGLAVSLLSPKDRGLANGIQVAAYRLGMIIGGGGILALFDLLRWPGAFLCMAGLLALTIVPALIWRPAPTTSSSSPSAPAAPWHLLRRPGATRLLIALFVFKSGEAAATAMLRPWLVDRGLGLESIGALLGGVGFTGGLLGALAGGWAAGRFRRARLLRAAAVLQAFAILGYAGLVLFGASTSLIGAVAGLEHFFAGVATAALFTTMMDRCDPRTASTDYTIQASAVVIATGVSAALAGYSASALGYSGHFLLAAGVAGLSPFVVGWLVPSDEPHPLAKGAPPMTRAIYPGTFDPITAGHLAVIDAARRVFDEVIVLLADNPDKTTLFDLEERRALVLESLSARPGVRVDTTSGLVAVYAQAHGVRVLVRGLRGGAEAAYELDLARANRTVAPDLETVILPAPAELEAVSSSLLKQMASAGLDGRRLCPPPVWDALSARLGPPRTTP